MTIEEAALKLIEQLPQGAYHVSYLGVDSKNNHTFSVTTFGHRNRFLRFLCKRGICLPFDTGATTTEIFVIS